MYARDYIIAYNQTSMKVIEQLSALLKKHNIQGVQLSEVVEVKMSKEDKLADGTMVATPSDDFVVGAELYVIDADGNPQPAPDGEHTLEDGTILKTEGGVISEVQAPSAEEEELSADIAAVIAAMDEQLTSIKNQLAEQSTELASVKAELSSAKNDLIKSQAKVAELSKKPAAVSVKDEKVVEQKVTFSNIKNKEHRILAMIANAKNK